MQCTEYREQLFDVVTGEAAPAVAAHFTSCPDCAQELESMRKTMALLDEWQAPEPSPYFDVRLQARLREEMAKPQAGWLHWFRRPVLAAALTVIIGIGIGLFLTRDGGHVNPPVSAADLGPGSPVSDLQTLEKNNDLYANFELLDDLDLQQDVAPSPQNTTDDSVDN